MITSQVENISTKHLKQVYKTINGVGLCYLDPSEEVLKEFSEDVFIPIYPGEESRRQFYIVKDDTTLQVNTLALKVTSEDPAYIVKTSLEYDKDLTEVPVGNTLVVFFSQYPSGIIPVTIYTKNTENVYDDILLTVEMEVL